MRLSYLPVNQCYAFTLGDSIVSMYGQRLFASRVEAVEAARFQGLTVARNGLVACYA